MYSGEEEEEDSEEDKEALEKEEEEEQNYINYKGAGTRIPKKEFDKMFNELGVFYNNYYKSEKGQDMPQEQLFNITMMACCKTIAENLPNYAVEDSELRKILKRIKKRQIYKKNIKVIIKKLIKYKKKKEEEIFKKPFPVYKIIKFNH